MFLEKIENCFSNGWTVKTKTIEETTDCLFWYHNRKTVLCFDWALNVLTDYAPIFNALTNLEMQWISLLRFDNKHLSINSEKQIWKITIFWTINFWFSKSWDCLEIEIDQRVWDRISACIDFRFASITSVILVFCWTSLFVCLLRSDVCSWGDQDQHS